MQSDGTLVFLYRRVKRSRVAEVVRREGMSGAAPLLPGGGSRSGRSPAHARKVVLGASFAFVLAAIAVLCVVGRGPEKMSVLAQLDPAVQRQRRAWDSLDSDVLRLNGMSLKGPATLSQLAASRTRNKDWGAVDEMVGLMDKETDEVSSLQQLKEEKQKEKKEKKETAKKKSDGSEKKSSKQKSEKESEKQAAKEEKDAEKGESKAGGGCCGDVEVFFKYTHVYTYAYMYEYTYSCMYTHNMFTYLQHKRHLLNFSPLGITCAYA